MVWPSPAWADHAGALREAPMSPLAAALTFGGLALLIGAVVVVVVAVLTRPPGPRDPGE